MYILVVVVELSRSESRELQKQKGFRIIIENVLFTYLVRELFGKFVAWRHIKLHNALTKAIK